MNKKVRENVYQKAFDTYGKQIQIIVAIEEMSELQKVLCKILREKRNPDFVLEELDDCNYLNMDDLYEELSDVEIMLEQIKLMFSLNEVFIRQIKDEKLLRLEKRIEGE